MLAHRNPFAGGSQSSHDILPKPTRKPLQPRNSNVLNSTMTKLTSAIKRNDASKAAAAVRDCAIKDELKASEEMGECDWNKENIPVMVDGLDSSLGEELIVMRKRVERLKMDKEETEKRLKERDAVFDVWRENAEWRREEQRKLEVEMDRVFRINQMRAFTRISPVRSLRGREAPLSILKWGEDDMEESVGENSEGSHDRRSIGNSGELNSVSAESKF